jgi:predicted AAA+ superfamily ATPase
MKNPFMPSYGSMPPLVAGREEFVRQFEFGLENGPGDPNRSTVLTGPRGAGKTVLLHWISERSSGGSQRFIRTSSGLSARPA